MKKCAASPPGGLEPPTFWLTDGAMVVVNKTDDHNNIRVYIIIIMAVILDLILGQACSLDTYRCFLYFYFNYTSLLRDNLKRERERERERLKDRMSSELLKYSQTNH